jgi:hypothetical protein
MKYGNNCLGDPVEQLFEAQTLEAQRYFQDVIALFSPIRTLLAVARTPATWISEGCAVLPVGESLRPTRDTQRRF